MRYQANGVEWPDVVTQAVAFASANDCQLLVVDTFGAWSGLKGDQENAAGSVQEALAPLMDAAAQGLALLIIAHHRKGAGANGEGVRGSSALTGSVDIVLELTRPAVNYGPNVRLLTSASRFDGTPPEIAVQLTADGYCECGSVDDLRGAFEQERILSVLSSRGQSMSADDIAGEVELPRASTQRHLKDLVELRRLARTGTGRRGSPYAYAIVSSQGGSLTETNRIAGNNEDDTDAENRSDLVPPIEFESGEV
jgi:hypothetical protein